MEGKLFFVIGASGAGKDSVLQGVRRRLPADAPLVFAHRYITRAAALGGENHIELSQGEFQLRVDHACFAMHWCCHGLHYGIGIEINAWLDRGLHVVVNGSRDFLNNMQSVNAHFPTLVPVQIEASEQIRRKRLLDRGRENAVDVEARMQRSKSVGTIQHPRLICIENNHNLIHAVEQFIELVYRGRD